MQLTNQPTNRSFISLHSYGILETNVVHKKQKQSIIQQRNITQHRKEKKFTMNNFAQIALKKLISMIMQQDTTYRVMVLLRYFYQKKFM